MKEFIENAKNFTRNPLGIIGLFITLVYGFANLLLGFSGNNLDNSQKWIMVIFVVKFPICILIAFIYLVTCHHTKLYAPSEYKNEENFLSGLNIEKGNNTNKINKEVETIESTAKELEEEEKELKAKSNELKEPNAYIRVKNRQEYKNIYLMARNFVINKLMEENNVIISSDSILTSKDGKRRIELDGFFKKGDTGVAIDIKYMHAGITIDSVALSILRTVNKIENVSIMHKEPLEIILVVVYESISRATLKRLDRKIRTVMEDFEITFSIKLYDMNELNYTINRK